jgi:hypothetical protein
MKFIPNVELILNPGFKKGGEKIFIPAVRALSHSTLDPSII